MSGYWKSVASVVPHPERLVDEMRRVCKPGGRIFMVNHFHSRNPVLGGVERLLAPLSKQLGFRPNFSLDDFLCATVLDVRRTHRVNVFGFSTMVEVRNNKPVMVEAEGKGAGARPTFGAGARALLSAGHSARRQAA